MAALGIELGLHLEILGNEIANGANALFTKYGPSALSGLQNGFNAIGSGFSSLGDSLKDVFSVSTFPYLSLTVNSEIFPRALISRNCVKIKFTPKWRNHSVNY